MKCSRNIFLKALQRACLCGVILIGCLFIHHAAPAGDVWIEPVTGMEFVKIPGGCFQMGSPVSEQERDLDEGPVHQVCVDSFWLGKYEVTNAQYRQWQPKHDSRDYHGHSLNGEIQPVGYVHWNDANAFAEWLTKQHETPPIPENIPSGCRQKRSGSTLLVPVQRAAGIGGMIRMMPASMRMCTIGHQNGLMKNLFGRIMRVMMAMR